MSLSAATLTSSFLVCEPTPATTVTSVSTQVFTTTYCVTLPAACPTSQWLATYTVVETCTGNPAVWTPPVVPPSFVTTTVACNVCAQPSTAIICPPGPAPTPATNGVTVTVAPPAVTTPPASKATNTVVPVTVTSSTPQKTGVVVVAAAPPSLKNSLFVAGGIAMAAAQFLLMA